MAPETIWREYDFMLETEATHVSAGRDTRDPLTCLRHLKGGKVAPLRPLLLRPQDLEHQDVVRGRRLERGARGAGATRRTGSRPAAAAAAVVRRTPSALQCCREGFRVWMSVFRGGVRRAWRDWNFFTSTVIVCMSICSTIPPVSANNRTSRNSKITFSF